MVPWRGALSAWMMDGRERDVVAILVGAGIMYGSVATPAHVMCSGELALTALLMKTRREDGPQLLF